MKIFGAMYKNGYIYKGQRAVGEGRAVVEAVKGFSFILFQQLVVEVHVLPALEHVMKKGRLTAGGYSMRWLPEDSLNELLDKVVVSKASFSTRKII